MSLEPVWAVKCPTITVVVSRLDGAVLMLPSKMPLILEGFGGLPTEGKALLLVGFKAWFQGPPACAHQAGCRTMPLTACLERDFGRACLACWQPKGSLEGFLDAGFQLIHVSSQAVVRAAAAPPPATAQEARDHLSSAALAIALVAHKPLVGLVVGDFSEVTGVALDIQPGCGSTQTPQGLLLSTLLRAAFLMQAPLVVLAATEGDWQLSEVAGSLNTFVLQTGYLPSFTTTPSGPWVSHGQPKRWVVLASPELGKVPLKQWPLRQSMPPGGLGQHVALADTEKAQALWVMGQIRVHLAALGLHTTEGNDAFEALQSACLDPADQQAPLPDHGSDCGEVLGTEVTASCAGTLREIALDLPLSWHSPGSPPDVAQQVLLGGTSPPGELLHACDWVPAGTELLLIACGPKPPNTQAGWPAIRIPKNLGTNMGEVPAEVRLEALRGQAQWLADDQISFLLDVCAEESGRAILVVDPLLASAALHNSSPAPFEEALAECPAWAEAITVAWHLGHWIAFHWKREGSNILAWVNAFCFAGGPTRPAEPGFCGYFALADLRARLHSAAYLTSTEAVQSIGNALGPFVAGLDTRDGVRFPCLLGGGPHVLLESGLSAILRERGVPEDAVEARVHEAVQRVGAPQLQQAMQSSKQWQELKAVCNNCSPPFQLVLPSELRGLVEAKLRSGETLGPRRKTKGQPKPGSSVAGPVVPQPHQVIIPEAEFEHDGNPLSQISLREVGPVATGVVALSAAEAQAYLSIAVSSKALGLLVFGQVDLSVATVKHEKVRFQAKCVTTEGPMLLTAVLLQIGDRFVQKRAPAKVETLELPPSSIVRVAIYRHEWAGPWSLVQQKPIRALLEALLEVWGRSYVSESMRPASAEAAFVFNAFLRVPAGLLETLLGFSGGGGIYFEPRGDEARQHSPLYSVAWMPKATRQEVTLARQSTPQALGIARIGQRFGVRSKVEHAEEVHSLLKPASTYFKQEGALTFHAGPWPYGSQRGAIAKVLESWGHLVMDSVVGHQGREILVSEAKAKPGPKGPVQEVLVALFEQQTARIEELLGPKRQRHECWADAFHLGLLAILLSFRFGLHVASFLLGSTWILGAAIYGLPVAPAATETLLQAATTRVVLQGQGPRFLAGDFNLEPEAQQLAPFWEQHGFLDVQDLWHRRCGQLPQVTCKASTRKDFLYVSAEFHHLLEQVTVDDTWFCDHAVLSATFRLQGLRQPCPIWRMPRPRQLPSDMQLPLPACVFPALAPDGDPSQSYRLIWEHYENHLSHCLQLAGNRPLSKSERGRAETTEVTVVVRQATVVPVGRHGEVKPAFVGSDRGYALWFRQLRRLQALVQSLAKSSPTDTAVEYRAGLWHAICRAPGFFPNFRAYWPTRSVVSVGDPAVVPVGIPGLATARALFAAFQANVNAMEKHLQKTRKREAKARRAKDPMMIFRDIGSGRAAPVESIVEGVSAKVSAVDPACGSVGFAADVDWQADAGFLLNQKPVEVHHAEPDMLWGDFALAKVGDVISQQTPTASLPALFRAFGDHWTRFWLKHEQVDPDTWRRLVALESSPAVAPYEALPLTVEGWREAVRAKHAFSATGPDGVSRTDLLALPVCLTEQMIALCHRAESTGSWPRQMVEASVTAEKMEGATVTGHYRPICVLSFPYRVWASIRANLPGKTAGAVWWALQLEIEEAAMTGRPLVGAFLDLSKAFNTLPRAPVFALALHYGVPAKVVKAWSGAVL
ncbi:unnamed protein product [Symbiodinium sp. CCMP2592]|nr:unnamed protein product [Symbiodinium sp. CCMP2592]